MSLYEEEKAALDADLARIERNKAAAIARMSVASDLPAMPVDATFTDKAQAYQDMALEALASIAIDQNAPASARVAASRELLDRAQGRSVQQVTVDHSGAGLMDMLADMREVRRRVYDIEDAELIE